MRTYGTIRSTFWMRGSGKRLRGNPEAQVLSLYLMTCAQGTLCGIFPLALPTIAHETGIPLDRLQELFEEIGEIARYDEEDELCWLPNAAREQLGASLAPKDKKRSGLIRELKQFGNHQFVREFHQLYESAYQLDRSPFEAPSKPLRSPLQGEDAEAEAPSKPPGSASGLGSGLDQDHPGGCGGELAEEPPPRSMIRKRGEPPAPRSEPMPTPISASAYEPTDEHRAFATELGLSERAFDEALTELRDKHGHGGKRHDLKWWDIKLNRFLEAAARPRSRRGAVGDDSFDPFERAQRLREAEQSGVSS